MMLSVLLRLYRKHYKVSLKAMEKKIGVSYVTLHRFEHGKPIEHPQFMRIWNWLIEGRESK